MKKIYIKPDMFPMGQEPEIIYEDEIGTFYYDEKEDMKQCDVCNQHFKNDVVTEGKDGFTICKWCLEFEDYGPTEGEWVEQLWAETKEQK